MYDRRLDRFIIGVKMRKSKQRLAVNGWWLHLTRCKYAQNFRQIGHREPVVLGRFCLCYMCCSPRVPRGAVCAANTSRRAAAGRWSGDNTSACFIESSFNACLKAMFFRASTGRSKKDGNICFLCNRKTVQRICVIFWKHGLCFEKISLRGV